MSQLSFLVLSLTGVMTRPVMILGLAENMICNITSDTLVILDRIFIHIYLNMLENFFQFYSLKGNEQHRFKSRKK